MSRLLFDTKFGYKIPDYIVMICLDCASRKSGLLRPRNYPMKSMCDMCEKKKPDVYNIHDFDWSEYTIDKREQEENEFRADKRAKSEKNKL